MMSKRAAKVASMGDARFAVEWESRSCTVGQRNGYFHCWERRICGDQIQVVGIVEFSECVKRVDPESIAFRDETNALLFTLDRFGVPHDG